MQIFGLDPVVASLIIAIVGVTYSVGLGYVKSPDGLSGKKVVTSVLIAIPGSIILVATGIRSMADTTDELMIIILVVGWVLQISGTDNTVKGIASVLKRK